MYAAASHINGFHAGDVGITQACSIQGFAKVSKKFVEQDEEVEFEEEELFCFGIF